MLRRSRTLNGVGDDGKQGSFDDTGFGRLRSIGCDLENVRAHHFLDYLHQSLWFGLRKGACIKLYDPPTLAIGPKFPHPFY